MQKQGITAIIPTFNEEICIERAIKSVLWADEIIIVDSFSTDRTLEIARNYPVKIIQRIYENSSSQKNWAIPQASFPWIFLLDADECAEAEIEMEVREIQNSEKTTDAYWVSRRNFFMGKEVKYSGWQGDAVIRFFKRDSCVYEQKKVHAEVLSAYKPGRLHSKIEHHTYKNLKEYLRKFDRYSTWSAYDRLEKTKEVHLYHLAIKPLFRFIRHYFLRFGFMDGKVGFIISSMAAYSVFLRYLKAWRIQEGEELKDPFKEE